MRITRQVGIGHAHNLPGGPGAGAAQACTTAPVAFSLMLEGDARIADKSVAGVVVHDPANGAVGQGVRFRAIQIGVQPPRQCQNRAGRLMALP